MLKVMLRLSVMMVVGVAMAVMASPAQAEDLVVTSNADSGNGTLRAAVATAFDNGQTDNITFDLPEGSRTITLTSGQISFTDTHKTTIDGGTAGVTVSGNDQSRMFQVNAGVDLSLTNLTVRDGRANWGAGIHNQGGTLTISRSTISENSATLGGGIYNESGTLSVTDSTISNNSTPNGFVSGGG
jgi:hypothetical protein